MSSRILENESASSIKKLKSDSNMSAYSSDYVETSESSDSDSEEDSGTDSNYEEPLPKKKKLVRMMKTLKNHQEDQEEGSGNKDGNSQEVKKMPMNRKIAEVLLTKNKTINRFLKYRQKKDQNNEKYVKINKEISKKLEEEFKINPNPTTERKKEIAEANKLGLRAVTNWFLKTRREAENPEKWKELNEKRRISDRERRRRKKAELNRPPKRMLFNEDQKNFMRARFQEFNYPTTKQCELWGQEIQLTGTQVCSFIIKERAFSKPGFRERQNERKRERRKGGPKVSRFRALSTPVERTDHQKKVALKTLKKIYQETDRPTLPMKKQIAEVLLTTPKNINKFFDYHRNKEQNEGKFVKIDKEISKKLEELFKINPNPTTERKKEIAEANKLKLQAVSHWFKTKRDRLKNPEKWDKINEKKRIMGREQRRKMKAQNQVRMMLIARSLSVFYSKFRLQALGYFRMRRNMDRKRIKKVPEEKDVPEFKGVWIRRQKEQVINQEEASDESDESDDNSDDSDDSDDMDMHNSGSGNFDSDESFTNSDEWDSDDDDKVDEFVKREPKEEPEDE
ncbi:hypothetical protein CRE_09379 [Caenorhabditis remanei]|uniref:Homeobox domain-containing protein n=1 Tax=Caenorhabditis remanei TaxID=31234 RepID=E3LII4_CAERE|nr:hypothetical protein CRE_09379 [Caenorhabditis remanei]